MIDQAKLAFVEAQTAYSAEMAAAVQDSLPADQIEVSRSVTIPFHGDAITAVLVDGEYMVPVKPICDRMGLDWEGQRQRIQRDSVLSTCTCVIQVQMPGDDQKRDVVCLPPSLIPGWLFTIDDSRVKPEIQESLIAYKREMYDVMHSYLVEGVALNPRMLKTTPQHLPSGVGTPELGSLTLYKVAFSVICEASEHMHDADKIQFLHDTTDILRDIYPNHVGGKDEVAPAVKLKLIDLVLRTGYRLDTLRIHALCRVTEQAASTLMVQLRKRNEAIYAAKIEGSNRRLYALDSWTHLRPKL